MSRRGQTITLEDILFGVGHGRAQSVGNMRVIPLVDEGGIQDENIAPPEVEVDTSTYGTVRIRNTSDRPTVIPPGAGWVVKEQAQDHAIGGGKIVGPGKLAEIDTAMCIQSYQGGTISRAKHDMLIIPASIRTAALALRKQRGYDKLWGELEKFQNQFDIHGRADLVTFLKQYAKQLDEFVAEFELVPGQIGAVIMVNDKVVGIEVAPSEEYWRAVWNPLIRVCYGSLALKHQRALPPPNREPLALEAKSLAEIRTELDNLEAHDRTQTRALVERISKGQLFMADSGRVEHGYRLSTVATPASPKMAGQIVESQSAERTAPFLSICSHEE